MALNVEKWSKVSEDNVDTIEKLFKVLEIEKDDMNNKLVAFFNQRTIKPNQRCSKLNKFTCGIICIDQDQILMVKQKESQKWGFPKGSTEHTTDETYLDTSCRELFEETGIFLDKQTLYPFYWKCNESFYFVTYIEKDDFIIQVHDKDEIEEVAWVKIQNMESLYKNYNCKTFHRVFINQH